jgi:hypothetical protein
MLGGVLWTVVVRSSRSPILEGQDGNVRTPYYGSPGKTTTGCSRRCCGSSWAWRDFAGGRRPGPVGLDWVLEREGIPTWNMLPLLMGLLVLPAYVAVTSGKVVGAALAVSFGLG